MQLAAVEEGLAAQKAELEELLASHKAVQLAKDQAKADLVVVEQELRGSRAARDAQLQHHSGLVSIFITTLHAPGAVGLQLKTKWAWSQAVMPNCHGCDADVMDVLSHIRPLMSGLPSTCLLGTGTADSCTILTCVCRKQGSVDKCKELNGTAFPKP